MFNAHNGVVKVKLVDNTGAYAGIDGGVFLLSFHFVHFFPIPLPSFSTSLPSHPLLNFAFPSTPLRSRPLLKQLEGLGSALPQLNGAPAENEFGAL